METRLSSSAHYVNKNPNYRGRVRSGCFTCRTKKVKCDEQRPTCKRCTRLKRECVYRNRVARSAIEPLPSESLVGNKPRSPPTPENSYIRPPSPFASNIRLPDIHELSQAQERSAPDSSRLSQIISQDIYLVTTIDWLATNESLQPISFSNFLHEVDLPLVTSFDSINWVRMKRYAVELATQHKPVAAAISAVQLLFRAQANSLPVINAMSRYELAKRMAEETLQEDNIDFETILVNVFINLLFSVILLEGTDCILRQSDGPFVERLKAWSLSRLRTPIISRLSAWLKIIHTAAKRGGNQGIMSATVSELLSDQVHELPCLSCLNSNNSAPVAAHELTSALVFRFYLDLQELSLQIADLSHYHRSRTTSTDQEEVTKLMANIKADLYSLWRSRPDVMRYYPNEIRVQFPSSTEESLITLIAIVMAAYHAEHVEIGRNLNEPQSETPEAQEAMSHIRDLVENEREISVTGQLNAGFLRPLFLYAIETVESESAQWAVDRIREIKDPICRSDFFASYTQSITEAQRLRERRITTRWFCYQQYGVRPPIL